MNGSIRECGVWPLGLTIEVRRVLIVGTFNFTCNFDRRMKSWIVSSGEHLSTTVRSSSLIPRINVEM